MAKACVDHDTRHVRLHGEHGHTLNSGFLTNSLSTTLRGLQLIEISKINIHSGSNDSDDNDNDEPRSEKLWLRKVADDDVANDEE